MGTLTNRLSLPQPIVDAVAHDDYSRGKARISVTGLINPPRQRVLTERHADAITEDAADRIWLLVGKIGHLILERANRAELGKAEERLYAEVLGWIISGATDHLTLIDGVLSDYKFVSVWSIVDGPKPEYVAQTNLYAYLWHLAGIAVGRLQIVAVLRDWRKNEALRYASSGYPSHQVAVLPVEQWPWDRTRAYLEERVRLHQAAEVGPLPHCTPEERWQRDPVWAVVKDGNKKATKLCKSEDEAKAVIGEAPKMHIEFRPGVAVRCTQYCAVKPWCEQLGDGQFKPGELGDTEETAA